MKKKRNEIYLQQFLDFSAGFLIVKIVIPETGVLGMVNEGSNAVFIFRYRRKLCVDDHS